MSLDDHSHFYEVLDSLETVGVVSRVRARIRSTGVPVIINRLGEDFVQRAEMKIVTDLKRWGPVRNPRLPLLIDAWQCDGRIEFAMIEQKGIALNDRDGHLAFAHSRLGVTMEVVFQTLMALSALQDAGVSHETLRARCFEVLKDGTITMRGHGLLERLNSHTKSKGTEAEGTFVLSSNLMRHDVGDWALAVGECLSGKMLADLDGLATPLLSPPVFENAKTEIRRAITDKSLADFVVRALGCRGIQEAEFDSALDARKAFQREFPKAARP